MTDLSFWMDLMCEHSAFSSSFASSSSMSSGTPVSSVIELTSGSGEVGGRTGLCKSQMSMFTTTHKNISLSFH